MEIERRSTERPAIRVARWPHHTFLGALSRPARESLLSLGSVRQRAAGTALVREGDTSTDVIVLIDGWAKVTGSTREGGHALLALQVGGDLIGEQAALEDAARTTSVTSAGPVVIRTISREDFLAFLRRTPEANLEVSRALSAKLSWATRRRIDFSGLSVLVRLARVVHELAQIDGRVSGGTIELRFGLTQPELAAMVGASEPSVHKALRQLRTRDVLDTGYRRILIRDPDALEAIADSASGECQIAQLAMV